MHLVIVAGGLGSRLAPLTNSIPKFLVNIGKETGFVEQIRYWKKYNLESITVIVHSSYKDLVQAYYDLYFKDDEDLQAFNEEVECEHRVPFHIRTVDVANGSAHAIFSTCQHLHAMPVMFSWCDVLPGEEFDVKLLNDVFVAAFTNYDHPNRYDLLPIHTPSGRLKTPALREDGRGGIFGVYYLSSYSATTFEDGQDFVECLQHYMIHGAVDEIKIKSIIDWGDMPKLERTRATDDGARSFNSVEMHGALVLKAALNEQGEKLIKREIAWYDELSDIDSAVSRPLHWSSSDKKSFVMSRVQGVPVWTLWPSLDNEGRTMVLERLFDELVELHSYTRYVGNDAVNRDLAGEALDKLILRHDEIQHVIKAFGPVTWVNGQKLQMPFSPKLTIEALFKALKTHYAEEDTYSLIHGDLQMSNSMINPDTLEVTLIDPRGYFGKSELFGLPDYDIAKLLYALSGYDLFNSSKTFHLAQNGLSEKNGQWNIGFEIPSPNLGGCNPIIMKRFKKKHYLWLAVNWIGLAQYIKNDPVKSVAAHFHGLAMAERLLDGEQIVVL